MNLIVHPSGTQQDKLCLTLDRVSEFGYSQPCMKSLKKNQKKTQIIHLNTTHFIMRMKTTHFILRSNAGRFLEYARSIRPIILLHDGEKS